MGDVIVRFILSSGRRRPGGSGAGRMTLLDAVMAAGGVQGIARRATVVGRCAR